LQRRLLFALYDNCAKNFDLSVKKST